MEYHLKLFDGKAKTKEDATKKINFLDNKFNRMAVMKYDYPILTVRCKEDMYKTLIDYLKEKGFVIEKFNYNCGKYETV